MRATRLACGYREGGCAYRGDGECRHGLPAAVGRLRQRVALADITEEAGCWAGGTFIGSYLGAGKNLVVVTKREAPTHRQQNIQAGNATLKTILATSFSMLQAPTPPSPSHESTVPPSPPPPPVPQLRFFPFGLSLA